MMQNILAQDYVIPEKYPWIASPEFLEWPYRNNLIVDKLLEMEADIVCLQEVQNDLFPDIMLRLSQTYHGILQNVSETHNVGTALLLHKDCPISIKRAESRSRALITVLEDKQNGSLLYVCSVHLDADKAWDRPKRQYHQNQRESQLKSLIKRIHHQCTLDNKDINDIPIIIAGDFNILRNNPINAAMSNGEIYPHCDIPLRDVYLQNERDDRSSLVLYDDDDKSSATVSTLLGSNHHLRKTYRGGAVLDYIYVSDQVQVLNTLLCHAKSSTAGGEQWPSHDHPSDHLPVGIDFEWNSGELPP
jgi:CCR4-NOT transcription complex subunit 6